MKKTLMTIISALTLGAALPALAGPDWQAIEQARKAKQVAQAERQGDIYAALAPDPAGPQGEPQAGSQKCPPDRLMLSLDHGPRAHTTPSRNRARQERYEAQLKACGMTTPDKSANPARPGK